MPPTSLHPRLADRVRELAGDRASSAADLVREAAEHLAEWVRSRPEEWTWELARSELDEGLCELRAAHGWRGPVALFFDALAKTLALSSRRPLETTAGEVLGEELGLWLGGVSGDPQDVRWDGRPLAPGRRLLPREDCVRALLPELERGETVLVHGFSETVTLAISAAQKRGLAPRVLLSEGGPDLGGRRMARRLVREGVRVTLTYDAALHMDLGRADRVWLGTEAIGADAFLARVGTRALLAEARRLEVPTYVLATSDKLTPRGELTLPEWCAHDRWLLWENAPEGVDVESQAFETVPLDLPTAFATECGLESAASLSLRSLRTDAQLQPIGS